MSIGLSHDVLASQRMISKLGQAREPDAGAFVHMQETPPLRELLDAHARVGHDSHARRCY